MTGVGSARAVAETDDLVVLGRFHHQVPVPEATDQQALQPRLLGVALSPGGAAHLPAGGVDAVDEGKELLGAELDPAGDNVVELPAPRWWRPAAVSGCSGMVE